MSAKTQRFTFPGSNGNELAARLDLPSGPPRAYALFAHCFTCTKDILAASRIADGLTGKGIGVLRFDFTGLGGSDGEFSNTNFSSNVDDLIAAADHMRENLAAPQILIGHSLGGAAVLMAAGKMKEVRAVATIAAPADPAHVAHTFQSFVEEIETTGTADVLLGGRPFQIQKQFIEDIRSQNLEAAVAKLHKALLILHAPGDEIVGIENAAQLFQAAKHPKSFITLDGADHLLSRSADAKYAAEIIATWAGRYIDVVDSPKPKAIPGTVIVAETTAGKFTNTIVTGSGHVIVADEPESVGGDDTGATPYDLLLSSLGACKTMTMRMYAERKGYALEHAEVRLSHDKIYAKDCESCETKTGKIDQIKTEITLTGDLSDEERQKVFEIAERCPVHRTITSEIIIEAKLKS
ncbi:MAG: alpha/beta fold hydrolase [Rhizobiaceae bacterium]|nr:alpha/beta fold hydrolase [Rhizobiaceae bacterium]